MRDEKWWQALSENLFKECKDPRRDARALKDFLLNHKTRIVRPTHRGIVPLKSCR